jgi:hypothetical protein
MALVFCVILSVVILHPESLLANLEKVVTPKFHPILVSNLRNTVSNMGTFGTRFGSAGKDSNSDKPFPGGPVGFRMPIASCEWPAGSRNMYLNEGELWVGALVEGDTAVTTGHFSGQEWIPLEDIEKRSGSTAFSDQDTYTRYDDGYLGKTATKSHLPLGIQVSQLTFAWAGDDHIIHALLVKNTTLDDLDSAYIGFCWDFNISSAARSNPALGDMVGLDMTEEISYMYDEDGDGGRSPGYIGGKFLYRPLAGHSWWDRSHDPQTDAQRYALMAGGQMADPITPGNYRVLHSVGPFDLPAGRAIPVLHTLAIGNGLSGLQEAVSDAKTNVGESLLAAGDSTLAEAEAHIIEVTVSETKAARHKIQFAVDWEFCNLGLHLVNPNGMEIYPEMAVGDPRIIFTSGPHRKAFLITDPLVGTWQMHIGYLSGPPSFPYRHSVTLFDLPYDDGLPFANFHVDWAYIKFRYPQTEQCFLDSFEVNGEFELREGQHFDPDIHPVFFRMGPYTETIPESSFVPCPGKYDCYEYFGCPPGIRYMILEFCNDAKGTWGWFDVYGDQVDMSGAEMLTLVRLASGQNSGFEVVLMEDHGDEWWYWAGEPGKARARTVASSDQLPGAFTLHQNYPNPFNATTMIEYDLPQRSDITLSLYNVKGQRVAVLVSGQQPAGTHHATWDGKDAADRPVSSGIYFCRLQSGELAQTRKMILLR